MIKKEDKKMVKRVLYIEDDRDTAEAVKLILGIVQYEVDLAYTGIEGINLLSKKKYDLVIFDIMLPDMSGIEVFEKISVLKKENQNCKYVFLSILNVPLEKRKELAKKGVVDYITKPFKKEDLINRIGKVLEEGKIEDKKV